MRLDRYTTGTYTAGAPLWKQLLWYFFGAPIVRSYLIPFSGLKVNVLRWFGAEIGQGVRIKTGVRVKFPWRLIIKDFVWIGEDAWLDNLDWITLDHHRKSLLYFSRCLSLYGQPRLERSRFWVADCADLP